MTQNKEYTCALFDVDGTILDTETCHLIANQEIINEYGNGKKYSWDVRRLIMGKPVLIANQILIENYEIKLTPEEMIPIKKERIDQLLENVKILPGIKQIMLYLKQIGMKIAAATSTSYQMFERKLKNYPEIRKLFDVIVCGDNPNVKQGKPAPDVFIYAAHLLGESDMSKTIIFEDSPNGAGAGLASGGLTLICAEKECRNDPAFQNVHYYFDSWKDFQPSIIGRSDFIDYID